MFRFLDVASKCFLGGAFAFAMLAHLGAAQATTFKVLHSFSAFADGCYPLGGLILDGSGNLYGTTAEGASPCNCGTVFKIPRGGAETPLYDFTCGSNGEGPDDTLVMDKNGNLYGATFAGGSIGCGVIFKVRSDGREETMHDFSGTPDDGCIAEGALIMDNTGNLYDTTQIGGEHNGGTVFKLARDKTERVLYSFCRRVHCADGESSFAGLTADVLGNFYGTTQSGGRLGCGNECGTVFKLAPDGTESVLFKFKGPPNDGNNPDGNLIIDQSGNYFGTLFVGGRAGCYAEQGCGAVFKLAPDGTETIPHFFTGKNGDGSNPSAGLISDSAGNLYGTTEFGGGRGCIISSGGCGTVFEIATNGTESVLHSFGKGNNGAIPASGLVADGAGNLYGTASHGGGNGYGTVFEITP